MRQGFYFFLRKNSFYAGCFTIFFLLTFLYTDKKEFNYTAVNKKKERNYYAGLSGPENDHREVSVGDLLKLYTFTYNFYQDRSASNHLLKLSEKKHKEHLFINIHLIPEDGLPESKFASAILKGKHDHDIAYFGEEIRKIDDVVFIYIDLSEENHGRLEKIYNRYKYVFRQQGVENVVWVAKEVFEKDKTDFTEPDWLFLKLSMENMLSDPAIIKKLQVGNYRNVPLIIELENDPGKTALESFMRKVPQLEGFISSEKKIYEEVDRKNSFNEKFYTFQLRINNEEFFIKGISYSFLSDGHIPLTRSQLRKDFDKISKMGANTIRRYHPSLYDRNIFETAKDFNLRVLYGFWFEPDVNYIYDSLKMQEYQTLVEKNVLNYKDSPALLGWSLSNETTGLLNNFFYDPELIEVKKSYLKFLEKLSARIKQIDPLHPVFIMIPYNNEFVGTVRAIHELIPSADIIGINAYDKDQLRSVSEVMKKYAPQRPYLISEFSPVAYWNEHLVEQRNGMVMEISDHEKSIYISGTGLNMWNSRGDFAWVVLLIAGRIKKMR
jgi:hypothetical protein